MDLFFLQILTKVLCKVHKGFAKPPGASYTHFILKLKYRLVYSKNRKNILVENKLLPVFQHGFLRSEENVDPHNLSESV